MARDKDGYTLVKQPGKTGDQAWRVTKPSASHSTPEGQRHRVLLQGLEGHQLRRGQLAQDPGTAKPTATIVAKSNLKGSGCTLKVGNELSDKQNSYMERAGAPDLFVVPKWSIDRVLVKVDDLKKKS